MNPINQTLFTARVTDDVPPRLSVDFGQQSLFKQGTLYCFNLVVQDENQIRISLKNKMVVRETRQNILSIYDCGKSLTLRKIKEVPQDTYAYVHDHEEGEFKNLDQVILQIQNSKLLARFSKTKTNSRSYKIPSTLVLVDWNTPAATQAITRTSANPLDDWNNSTQSTAPVATPPQCVYDRLIDCLPTELLNTFPSGSKKETIDLYENYSHYVANLNLPTRDRAKKEDDEKYSFFLQKEKGYLALQKKFKVAEKHNTLKFIIPSDKLQDFIPSSDEALPLYSIWREMSLTSSDFHQDLLKNNLSYQRLLQAEKDYLIQQALVSL